MKEKLTKKTIKQLESIVGTCICGPKGDPDSCHLAAAACAVNILKRAGVNYYDSEILGQLAGDNLYNVNFLKQER